MIVDRCEQTGYKQGQATLRTEKTAAGNTGLAKVAVQCSASTFVVKIATFAKPSLLAAGIWTTPHNRNHMYE